jgi:hypothetical protein
MTVGVNEVRFIVSCGAGKLREAAALAFQKHACPWRNLPTRAGRVGEQEMAESGGQPVAAQAQKRRIGRLAEEGGRAVPDDVVVDHEEAPVEAFEQVDLTTSCGDLVDGFIVASAVGASAARRSVGRRSAGRRDCPPTLQGGHHLLASIACPS